MPRFPTTVHAVWRSPAKVNLCLRVVGRRADGYHLLDSVFAAVDLCDDVTVDAYDLEPSHAAPTIEVRCDDPRVPCSGENLAARAAYLALAERGLGGHVVIELHKRIPPGSGLGGGSSNAATVLVGLDQVLGLAIPRPRLEALALPLGADVPFFLTGGVARVRGIGERVEPQLRWREVHLVLAIPPFGVSTASAFRAFAARRQPAAGADTAERLAAAGRVVPELLVNDLEAVVVAEHPEIGRLEQRLRDLGAVGAAMSGSGSTVFGVAPSAAAARSIAETLASEDDTLRVHAVELFASGGRAVDRSHSPH